MNRQNNFKNQLKFNSAFEKLLKVEGGYVDDPDDTGGKTRYGITERVARQHGYQQSMAELPLEVAKQIYKQSYWDKLRLDEVNSSSVCEELFDSCVNVGTKKAIAWLQSALNAINNRGRLWSDINEDGVVGEKTLVALNTACENQRWQRRLLRVLNSLQGAFYVEIARKREANEKFMAAWIDSRVRI